MQKISLDEDNGSTMTKKVQHNGQKRGRENVDEAMKQKGVVTPGEGKFHGSKTANLGVAGGKVAGSMRGLGRIGKSLRARGQKNIDDDWYLV